MITEVNKDGRNITIVLQDADSSDIVNIQRAITDLLKNYKYKEVGADEGTMYWALYLLEQITPDFDQQEKAFTNEGQQLTLPDCITPAQLSGIRGIIANIQTPGVVSTEAIVKQLLNKN